MTTKFRVLAGGALALLAAGWNGPTLADWHKDCRIHIERGEVALDRAVARWGAKSGQAGRQRHALYDAREWCWRDHHIWWDGHAHIWVTTHW